MTKKVSIVPRVSLRKIYESVYSQKPDPRKVHGLFLGDDDDDERDIASSIEQIKSKAETTYQGFDTFVKPILLEIKKYLEKHFEDLKFEVDYKEEQPDGKVKQECIELTVEKTGENPCVVIYDGENDGTKIVDADGDKKRLQLWNYIPQILGDDEHNIFAIVISAIGEDYLRVIKR